MTIVRLLLAAIFLALGAYWLGLHRRAAWALRIQPTPSRVPPLPFAFVALFLGLLNVVLALA
ncbi:MAG TPA: hypothetical protein VFU19_16345 [Iamia sp.]|nr:hypothetical protein [Iamia sp.]